MNTKTNNKKYIWIFHYESSTLHKGVVYDHEDIDSYLLKHNFSPNSVHYMCSEVGEITQLESWDEMDD